MADAADRQCGDCGLCCKLMGVEAITKPPGRWCRHFHRSGGCDIYETRPSACADFNCLWLIAPMLGEDWKPNRAGFVLHSENAGRRLIVECDPSRPHDWRRPPYEAVLRAWAAETGDRALEVLVFSGRRGLRLLSNGNERPVARTLA